nr:unnamed protein product [Callosobruchus chinensis]
MPTRATCKSCNQSCDNHLLVTCSVCKNRYKHSCVDITANEVRTLNGNKGYDWTCSGCRVIDQNKPAAEQIQQDKATVKELLQYVVPDMALSDVKSFRLGRHTTAKKRPIKVVLQNSDIVRNILKNSSSLKNSRNHRSIVISQDRTMKQIEYYEALKQELVDRKSAGETNLGIKYINDLPKMVPLN